MMNDTVQYVRESMPHHIDGWARTVPTLLDRVAEARAEAVDAGLRPTEVLLGPEEAAELIEYGTSRTYNCRMNTFLGLHIIRMTEPGVRVGCTFTGRDEE